MGRIAGRFARVEPRRRVRQFVAGLLAELPRTNCWTIAEHVGEATPYGLQHLLGRAVGDADAVRDDVRDYVVEHLAEPDAVLAVDETGDLKKGTATVGVQRQYTGTAGRTENAQVTVWLTYASRVGHGLVDRALYLPRCWAYDSDRRAAAGVPAGVGFATKPALARQMIARALDAGVPARWVTADEVYGADPGLRGECERRQVGYVLAVARDYLVPTAAGSIRADMLTLQLPRRAWQPLSAGAGAKGHRVYDWALIDIPAEAAGQWWLLVRRHRRTGKRAYYRCWAPTPVPLTTLVRVAGSRWAVEEDFQTGKELTALDQHQVRTWTSWHRWATLTLLAHAFLTVTAAVEHTRAPAPADQIPLTRNEIGHLFAVTLLPPIRALCHRLHWSTWRRRHQHHARTSHYQRQAREP
ncbi:MAG TPA: IS701 family transposase [Micromonosporaceae bacterium]|nr:IS701 family transposase [Micromonosporaceae bacterium]